MTAESMSLIEFTDNIESKLYAVILTVGICCQRQQEVLVKS